MTEGTERDIALARVAARALQRRRERLAATDMTEGKMDDFEGHTPGPWRVIHESDGAWGDNWAIVRADNALEDVAEMVVSAENARLIAAAPDLLAERDRLRAEVERLRDLGQKAVQHMRCAPLCAALGGYGYCSCGQQDVRAALEAQEPTP